jgi:hypothetical protein
MKPKILIMAAVLCTFLLVSGVAAADLADERYVVTSGYSDYVDVVKSISPMATTYSITQGEIDWYSVDVPRDKQKLSVRLDWGDTSDTIALTIYDHTTAVGTYYDSDDGKTDGCICLSISRSTPLTPGTWYFRVYGEEVEGTEDYTFLHSIA